MAAALACIPVERRLTASHPTTTTPFAKLFKDPFYSPLLFCRRQESRNPRLSFPSSPHKGGLAVLFSSFLVPASLYFLPATLSCVPSLNTVTTFRMENALRFGSTSLPSSSHVKEGRVQNAGISRTCDMKSAAAARHSDDRDRGLFVARKEREGFLKFPYVCVRERERRNFFVLFRNQSTATAAAAAAVFLITWPKSLAAPRFFLPPGGN